MKKIFTIFVFAVFLMSMVFVVGALKPNVKDIVDSRTTKEVFIPENAVEVAPGVFDLGKAKDRDGKIVSGLMFVHNKKEDAKPPWAGGGKNSGDSTCYSHLAKGARWKNAEDYVIGKDVDVDMMEKSIESWDSEVTGFEIFGKHNLTAVVDGDDLVSPDGKNEVLNKNLGSTSTIAYAVVWGIFGGPPFQRELIEWDIVFNTDFVFGDAGVTNETNLGDTNVMDYQNIATHELGHALGMGHSPTDSACLEETMYPTATKGETKKRTLNDGDIEGIVKLY